MDLLFKDGRVTLKLMYNPVDILILHQKGSI